MDREDTAVATHEDHGRIGTDTIQQGERLRRVILVGRSRDEQRIANPVVFRVALDLRGVPLEITGRLESEAENRQPTIPVLAIEFDEVSRRVLAIRAPRTEHHEDSCPARELRIVQRARSALEIRVDHLREVGATDPACQFESVG